MYKPSAEDTKREQRYQAESDVRTLTDAHKIKKDPQRHQRARAHAKEQMTALQMAAKK